MVAALHLIVDNFERPDHPATVIDRSVAQKAARFRADFTFWAVKTGLAGWGGGIRISAFRN